MKRGFRTCDVLIVGAGPAGCSAALEASELGLGIVMCEIKAIPGTPIRCAEHIPALLRREVAVDPSIIVQSVESMRTILPNGDCLVSRAPGYMIRRDLFDLGLAEACKKRGIELIVGSRVTAREGEDVVIARRGEGLFIIRPKVIVGADGPFSTVGRWMGSVNERPIPAVQARVHLKAPMDSTEVYFRREIVAGYGWLFPRGDEANAGLGMRRPEHGPSIYRSLSLFLRHLSDMGKIDQRPLRYMAGYIPVRPLERTVDKNMLLVGDAAGQTHPITGAGVPQAVVCGKMAGKWAARAAGEGNPDLLKGYDEEWKDLYWEGLERAYERRLMLEAGWDRMEDVLPRCWIGFRDYYRP
jgi:geranylgeranyl reductase family protein